MRISTLKSQTLFWTRMMRTDFSNIKFSNNGKLKLLIIVGTRPEIIRLAAVINKCREYFDTILAHTGQNYDYNLNGVFFKDRNLKTPDVYLDAVGKDLGETMGNIIASSYSLMTAINPDAVIVLGDTNSCLSVISAKRLHIPIFHMEAGKMLWRMPSRRNEPTYSWYNFWCQHLLLRTCTTLPQCIWSSTSTHLCQWVSNGWSVKIQSEWNRNKQHSFAPWSRKGNIFFFLPIGKKILIPTKFLLSFQRNKFSGWKIQPPHTI